MSRPEVNKIFEVEMEFQFGGQTFTLTFALRCPQCHWLYAWRKSPGDPHHSQSPPRFMCKMCHKQFYPHTSALVRNLEEPDRFEMLNDLFTTSKTLDSLERIYGIRKSRLSELKTWFLEKIKHNKDALMEAYAAQLPQEKDAVMIYMDGMAVRVQNTLFMLILAVDRSLNILSFAYVRKEKADTVYPVFQRALALKGLHVSAFQDKNNEVPPLIVVTDGRAGYRKMLVDNRVNCIHLAHIHKDGGQKLIIRLIHCTDKEVIETQMGTAIDVVKTSGTSQVRVITMKRSKKKFRAREDGPKDPRPKPSPPTHLPTHRRNPKNEGRKTPGKMELVSSSMLM